jgi:hypothetical protein
MNGAELTTFGWFLDSSITVDKGAAGAILELDIFYKFHMGFHERH